MEVFLMCGCWSASLSLCLVKPFRMIVRAMKRRGISAIETEISSTCKKNTKMYIFKNHNQKQNIHVNHNVIRVHSFYG